MTEEERSRADAAASKFLGIIEAKAFEFRTYLVQTWNHDPNPFELNSKAYNLKFDIDLAHTEFELEFYREGFGS